MKTPSYARNNYWLNLLKVDQKYVKTGAKSIIKKLNNMNYQLRPVWYPNHLQKPYKKNFSYKINNARELIKNLICLPSGSGLKKNDIDKIIKNIK